MEDLIDLAVKVQKGTGYDVVNVSTNQTHSINELTKVVARLMGKEHLVPRYVSSDNYWKKYPGLYRGAYTISEEALESEVVKFTQLSNEHAKKDYGWKPKVDLEQGIRNTIEFSVKVLEKQR